MSIQAVHLKISGMVQGVGFRYYAHRSANSLGLTGWVANLPNGAVEILAEGDRSLLEEFIKEMKVGPRSASVRDVDVRWTEATGKHRGFEVRFV
jgi:acylphosphatase